MTKCQSLKFNNYAVTQKSSCNQYHVYRFRTISKKHSKHMSIKVFTGSALTPTKQKQKTSTYQFRTVISVPLEIFS